jgi:hypothetical protein
VRLLFRRKLKWTTVLAPALLALALAAPVLADYLGPSRTATTTDVEYYDYGVWAKKMPIGSCPDNYHDSNEVGYVACIVCSWEDDPFSASCAYDYEYGYPNFYWIRQGTQARTVIHTFTYSRAGLRFQSADSGGEQSSSR